VASLELIPSDEEQRISAVEVYRLGAHAPFSLDLTALSFAWVSGSRAEVGT